jgi:hypothetical protein
MTADLTHDRAADSAFGEDAELNDDRPTVEQRPRRNPATNAAFVGVAGALVVCALAFALWLVFQPKQPKLGSIDLAGIVELEELALTARMMQPGLSDADRAQARDRVQTFGSALEQAIETVRNQCGCVLLAQQALVGRLDADYTAAVKEMVGLGKVDREALTSSLRQGARAVPDSFRR